METFTTEFSIWTFKDKDGKVIGEILEQTLNAERTKERSRIPSNAHLRTLPFIPPRSLHLQVQMLRKKSFTASRALEQKEFSEYDFITVLRPPSLLYLLFPDVSFEPLFLRCEVSYQLVIYM